MSASLKTRALNFADRFDPMSIEGAVRSVSGRGIEVSDRLGALAMSARVEIETASGPLLCEVASVSDGAALVLPFGAIDGVKRGARVRFIKNPGVILPSRAWLGRVVDGLGRPIDGKGPLSVGNIARPLRSNPPPAPQRARLGAPVDFGIKALNAFVPARAGQRLGVFSASGVGKSVLLGMMARNSACDLSVIALIGERGREVRDFIEDHLGEEGLSRSIVVVATSDQPAMMRREAGFLALTLAEHFRAEGNHVLCLMDSLTRIAMAQREIGLAAGEPPATKGYTPSVFSSLPALVERAGPGAEGETGSGGNPGSITGIFSVLVEGDDHDEPIADAARAILDGHIVLDRKIAERGRFPAVNILRSVSRTMIGSLSDQDASLVAAAKKSAALYDDMQELIRIGAYRSGANPDIDLAIDLHPELEAFLAQETDESVSIENTFEALGAVLNKETFK